MKQLELQLPSGKKKSGSLKSSWSEMTPDEVLRCCWVRSNHFHDSDQEALNASRIILFYILTGVDRAMIENITNAQWVDILPHMNFVFKVPDFKINPLPRIRYSIWSKPLHGPVGLLEKSRVEEFVNADTAFVKANKKELDMDSLYLLFSILWRPVREDLDDYRNSPEWDGDIREPFNSKRSEERASFFAKVVPVHVVVFSFLFYWSFREQKLMTYKNLFDQKNSGTGKKVGNDYGWAGPILELSGKNLGSLNDVKNHYWHTFILELSRQVDMAKQREEELNKHKK